MTKLSFNELLIFSVVLTVGKHVLQFFKFQYYSYDRFKLRICILQTGNLQKELFIASSYHSEGAAGMDK
jgi:hypothetical protein